jgi:IMP dehydrogenase
METMLSYDDILIQPQYSQIISRQDLSLKTKVLPNLTLDLPVIASPMDTVCEVGMAEVMFDAGGIGIVHRYNSIEDQVAMVANTKTIIFAIGVTGDFFERFVALYERGVRCFCLDVAHGHHVLTKRAIKKLKEARSDISIIAGAVASANAVRDLKSWGADAVRVGVGTGSICSTRIRTGHGVPNASILLEARNYDIPLLADGGCKNSGDIVKALACGASAVIVGSLLAGSSATPGEVHFDFNKEPGNRSFKTYRGMASAEAQNEWRGYVSVEEGVSVKIPYKGKTENLLKDLRDGILSGLSYSGASTIKELQENAILVRQTLAGQYESSVHIHGR